MEKLRVGVMGLGGIFHRVMADFQKAENCELYAVAARDGARAQDAVARYGAKRAFGSYAEMLECPEVELVYIATPHSLHREHALTCLAHGKHVLCEKAFALNDSQAREMVRAARANGLFLMEAMWTRCLPAMRALKQMADAGTFVEIRHITANFGYAAAFDPNSRIYAPELAGGALLDVGIYPLSITAMLLGAEPAEVQSACVMAPSGVDARTVAQLSYASGATAQFFCAVDTAGDSRMTVYGTAARVEIPDFWHATQFTVHRGGEAQLHSFPPENEGHHHQFIHAAECIRAGKTESPLMPLDETVALMRIMTQMRQANGFLYPVE
ncbi:MAG: Gfo/Idh/MocA family protein [Christensenellales bacterium]